jgi:SAM-dependent methyltransferase
LQYTLPFTFLFFRNKAGQVELTPTYPSLAKKDAILSPLLKYAMKGLSFLDVGGNYGYFCAKAMLYGADSAMLVDMDTTYTDIATKIYKHIGQPVSEIDIRNTRLGDLSAHTHPLETHSADVVLALALIHWSFNCSETRGSMAKTIGSLALRAKHLLIIEWIDPLDQAIQNENHLGVGRDAGGVDTSGDSTDTPISLESSPYTYSEFRRVMVSIFGCVQEIGEISPTRRIFVGMRTRGYQDARGGLDNGRYKKVEEWIDQNHQCQWGFDGVQI